MQRTMWSQHADSDLLDGFFGTLLEAVVVEAAKTLACSLLLATSSSRAINILAKDMGVSQRFPFDDLHAVKKSGPENVDGSETEDDDEGDNDDEDQEDDEDEEEDGGEASGDDEGDPEDEPEANADGNDDGDDDDDEDDDDDDEEEEEDEQEEEDEDELPQPPTKKRK